MSDFGLEEYDSDGDGIDDAAAGDSDGDGVDDTFALDRDGDGTFETIGVDTDGDEMVDIVQIDTDGDGDAEVVRYDEDSDGSVDRTEYYSDDDPDLEATSADTDGDGVEDTFGRDSDGDDVLDTFAYDTDGDGEIDEEVSDTGSGEGVHGGEEDQYYQSQAVSGQCGPTSAAMILSEQLGEEIPYEEVVERAVEMGLMEENADGTYTGMLAQDMEALMETYGIEVDVEYGTMETLEGYLDEGTDVIVAIDSGEVWGDHDSSFADHYVVVTEIDYEEGTVTLNDPGQDDGASFTVPLEDFENAWGEGGNEMLVSADEAGDVAPEDAAFDLSDGTHDADSTAADSDAGMGADLGSSVGEDISAEDVDADIAGKALPETELGSTEKPAFAILSMLIRLG